MSLKNTKESYGKVTIAIHWLVALLVIGLIIVGFYMGTLEKGPDKSQLFKLHKATGLLMLGLALFRWYWILVNERVRNLPGMSTSDIAISHATKWLLMLAILIMPVSGVIMSMAGGYGIDFYGLFKLPPLIEKNKELRGFFHELHEIGAWVISFIVVLHTAAAVKHHWINKDDTLKRMLGRK